MKKLLLLVCVLSSCCNASLWAQNQASVLLGDTLRLHVSNYRGTSTWQQGSDSLSFADFVAGQDTLHYQPSTESKWLRAKIEEADCQPYYETAFKVWAVDTNAANYAPRYQWLHALPAQLLSETSSTLVFAWDSGEFPLQAGDELAWNNGTLMQRKVWAVIVFQGQAVVYTGSSSASLASFPIDFGNSLTGNVMGQVTDENGRPLALAQVTVGNIQGITDINGVFLFENAPLQERMGYVRVSKPGYFPGSRSFVPVSGGNRVSIRLLATKAAGAIPNATGGTVSFEGVQLQFPPNAAQLNGQPYTGNVVVFANYMHPDSAAFFDEMPGNLWGNQEGNVRGLRSFGMMGVTLETSTGQALQLAPGSVATATFPLSDEWLASAPDTIDLWSFDEAQGIWQDEGEAVRVNNTYVAELPHFSFWNCDRPWEAVYVNGTVTDENGNPLSGVVVHVSNPAVGESGGYTNALGQFGGLMPKDMELTVTVTWSCDNVNSDTLLHGGVLGPFSTDTTLAGSAISTSNFFRSVRGYVKDCNGLGLNSGYVVSSAAVSFIHQGNFSLLSCYESDSLQVATTNPLVFGESSGYTFVPGLNLLDTLTLCGGDSLQFNSITDVDGNVYNTVKIGTQWWMAENLKTAHYADGSVIPDFNSGWGNVTEGRTTTWLFSDYYEKIYGKEYNWFACTDPRNLCPTGWHVPSSAEFQELINLLGGPQTAGGALKSLDLFGDTNVGASNSVGFTGIAAGYFQSSGVNWSWLGSKAYFWTATETAPNTAPVYNLWRDLPSVTSTNLPKNDGCSVRCVKD